MATPNRGYPIPITSAPATVPADLDKALQQVDADMQEVIDRVGEVETVADSQATGLAQLGNAVQTVQEQAVTNAGGIAELGARVGTVEGDVATLKREGGMDADAADLIASRLAFGTGDLTVGVAGDSTANDPGDWPRVMCSMLAARYPALRVEHYQWNDAATAYDPPVVVQEGEGEPAFSGTVLHDTFTRTTGIESPDVGAWDVLNPARWVLADGTATTTGAARLRTDPGARDATSTTRIILDTTATGAAQSLRFYHGTTANGACAQLTINAGGAATIYLYEVVSGALVPSTQQALNTALGVPINGPVGPVTVTITGAIQVYTVTVEYAGQSWTHQYTISESTYAVMAPEVALYPQNAIPGMLLDEVSVDVADRPATYQTLTVKAGTKGGGTLDYQIENWEGMFGDEESSPGTPPTPGGPVEVTARDTFTRTGQLAGTTADTGESWTGGSAWTTDGSSAGASTVGSAYLTLPAPETVETVRFDLSVITQTTASQTLRLGVAAKGDATNGVYIGAGITTAGAFNPSVYVRTPTGGFRTLGNIPGHGVEIGSTTAQAVPVIITREGDTFTVTVGEGTGTYTITPAEAAELGELVELQAATLAQGNLRVTEVTATYIIDSPGDPGTPPSEGAPLDVMIVAHGHNYGARDGDAYPAILDAFASFVRERRPSTRLLVSSQNPQFAPAASPVRHAERQAAARLWAKRHGHSYAPVFEHFHAQPDQGQAWVLTDGIHPTPSPGGAPTDGTGGTEWARVIVSSILG